MALTDNGQKKRIIIIAVCSVILVGIVVTVSIGFTKKSSKKESTNTKKNYQISDSLKAIKSICQPTDFKQTCEEQLRKEAGNSTDVKELMQAAFKAGVNFATQAAENSATLRELEQDPKSKMALENCKNLLTFSIYEFQKSISKINELDVEVFNKIYGDLKIWLSATITNQQTCLDGFQNTMTVTGGKLEKALNMSMKLSRIGLAIVGELSDAFNQLELQGISRRLLEEREMHVLGHSYWPSMMDKNPWKHHLVQEKEAYVIGHANWFTMLDENNPLERRLLQEKEPPVLDQKEPPVAGHEEPSEILDKQRLLQGKQSPGSGHKEPPEMLDKRPVLQEKEPHILEHADWSYVVKNDPRKHRIIENDPSNLKPNIVVAKDGSGNFNTIKDAMSHIPLNAQKPFVIYIKEGTYEENLIFSYNMTNVALIGDGKEKTRITGHLNAADGINTFNTATVAVNGDFFFAKNIGFENTAGAIKLQAVALMVISDFAVLYNCSIDGYQYTLYVHSKRQFYRDCTISGTIDFVFGDAAAVFQNCKFVVRKPLKGQQNVITAQGRSDERQPTGIVIQNSTIVADDELIPFKIEHPTFLGRPWGNFSRTIIMETFIDDLVKHEGWAAWDGHWGLTTSYYSEYNNHGPGSATTHRVSWPAIKRLSPMTALGFTPARFFFGDDWIKPKGVPYTSGFSNISNEGYNMKTLQGIRQAAIGVIVRAHLPKGPTLSHMIGNHILNSQYVANSYFPPPSQKLMQQT
ncbi:trichohyalin-like [Gossypium australe]|uniref:pectinesterase n=1 Tax=Gossypium australe TaxID=47621 RepID=A0A5B6VS78_9ROSI|nr:trichohyalin-like [Gossypium australe]